MNKQTQPDRRLFAPVLQIVRTEGGAIARRGTVRLHITGQGAVCLLTEIVQAASRPNGASRAEIVTCFNATLHPAIDELIDALVARRLLVTAGSDGEGFLKPSISDDREDIFYWTFGTDRKEVRGELLRRRISVIGVNAVSQVLTATLRQLEFVDVTTVDHPLLRSAQFCGAGGTVDPAIWAQDAPIAYDTWADSQVLPDCLVTTSDFGGLSLMREWNSFCVSSGLTFYPVVLQDMIGYAGPLVLPGETACFECLWLRQNSNFAERPPHRETEDVAFHGQIVDGFAPPMAAVLGHVAAFEIFRFYAGRIPGFRMSSVVEIDLLSNTMASRKLLRVPRCPVCGTGLKHAKFAIERAVPEPDTGARK